MGADTIGATRAERNQVSMRAGSLPRIHAAIFVCAAALCMLSVNRAGATTAYEQKGRIAVEGSGWKLPKSRQPVGMYPAISPSGAEVAFLKDGNVYVLQHGSNKIKKLTSLPRARYSDFGFLLPKIAWHSSGQWIVFTQAAPSEYDKSHKAIRTVTRALNPSRDRIDLVQTIWMANTRTGKVRLILGPMGDFGKLASTCQLEGASVYEPMFSPNGKSIWFLNAGWLYEVGIDTKAMKTVGKPRLIAKLGDGLDFASPGASKWGTGAQQLAWDARRSRLCFWIGRFWGSGQSDYGYITWNNGKWGKATPWHPALASTVHQGQYYDDVQGCKIDDKGYLWVRSFEKGWVRGDGKAKLPRDAENPDWGPTPRK